MEGVNQQFNDEIDLLELFQTVWDGKWKVVGFALISVLSVIGFQFTQPPPSFMATTELKPITSVEAERYTASNAVGFFKVTPSLLLDLYIEQLEERVLFEEAIRKFSLFDASKYEDEKAFNDAVIELAASIEILPPSNVDGKDKKADIRRYWQLVFQFNDDEKWKEALRFVDDSVSSSVRNILSKRFETSISIAQKKQEFELEDIRTRIINVKSDFDKEMKEFELKQSFKFEDIETLMQNAKSDFDIDMMEFEQNHKFQLEDITTQIENALNDYDRKTADRLAFLREQAAIARKLGVSKNTIEAQMFNAQNGVVANVKTDTPFYLRGYEAIEKEIELIELREEKNAFVSGLFELEKKKRELEQDKTLHRAEMKKEYLDELLDLERKKRQLEQDRTLQRVEKNKIFLDAVVDLEKKQRDIEQSKTLVRAEELFKDTPIASPNDFSAVSVSVEATDFEYKSKRLLMLALALVVGGMIGVIYVLILNAVRNRRQSQQSI